MEQLIVYRNPIEAWLWTTSAGHAVIGIMACVVAVGWLVIAIRMARMRSRQRR